MQLMVGTLAESSLDAAWLIARLALGAVLLGAALLLVTLWRPAPKMDA